ncbi:SGNH/GDSL hydrolase family protein [Paraburkholderia tropica]|uniref:SGNH/GDSL hydrolase family protein n=1 Tax=Paraburkholderia tropica TaxID=92647 RepID=UPI001F476D55|nr:SGNH/GDSL hydrolase family protein [Paraburkholderia tropica]
MAAGCTLTLSACGGGGGGDSPGSHTASAPASSSVTTPVSVVIDAEGDSTMYGTQSTNGLDPYQTPYNAPALMQQNLQSYVGQTVTVINDGKPGTSLSNRLFGTFGDAGVTWQQYLDTTPFQIVIENFGLNDSNPNNVWNESPADFQWDLTVFATAAVKAGRVVVFEEPNPCADPVWNAQVAQYSQIIDQVAAQYGIPLVKQYDYIMSLPNWQSLLIDGLHPTPDLYEIKASREIAVLLPIVKKLLN